MTPKEKLESLQLAARINTELISEYQKLYNLVPNKKFSVSEILDQLDKLADKNINFNALEKVIIYERENLNNFNIKVEEIKDIIHGQGASLIKFDQLEKELKNAFEAIKISYITIFNFDEFDKACYWLLEDMKEHRSVLQTDSELNL